MTLREEGLARAKAKVKKLQAALAEARDALDTDTDAPQPWDARIEQINKLIAELTQAEKVLKFWESIQK